MVLMIFTGLAVTSCLKDTNQERTKEQEEADLAWFLEENDITTPPLPSGLYYIEIEEGVGELPDTGDVVSIFYVGQFINGYIFDSNVSGLPLQIELGSGQVITGLEEGLFLMKKEGTARLIIPSELAYGEYGVPGFIAPYTTLVFDVEVFDIAAN
jgi:peptidylprolyl isomerase